MLSQLVILSVLLVVTHSYVHVTLSHRIARSSLSATPKRSENIFSGLIEMFNGGASKLKSSSSSNELKTIRLEVDNNREFLRLAAETKQEDSDNVVTSLLALEKLMRQQNKLDDGRTAEDTLKFLNGSWRLIFTTGTADTQKKIGRINYFPLKAVQTFDTASGEITNGIYITEDFEVLKFYGQFKFLSRLRKVEFDFDSLSILKLKFNLPTGGAAKIGQQTGLGSENNVALINDSKKPFFNWILADESIAVARGGGGGLALWQRVL